MRLGLVLAAVGISILSSGTVEAAGAIAPRPAPAARAAKRNSSRLSMWTKQARVRSKLATRYVSRSALGRATARVVKNMTKTRPNLASKGELQMAMAQGGNEFPELALVESTKQSPNQPLAHQPGEWQRATFLMSRVPEGPHYEIDGEKFELQVFSHDYTDGWQGPPVEMRLLQNGKVVSRRILQRDGKVHKGDLHPHLVAQVAASMHDGMVQIDDMSADDQNALLSARSFAQRNNKAADSTRFLAKRQYQGGATRLVVEAFEADGEQKVEMSVLARRDDGKYQIVGMVQMVDDQIAGAIRPELVARYMQASLLRETARADAAPAE